MPLRRRANATWTRVVIDAVLLVRFGSSVLVETATVLVIDLFFAITSSRASDVQTAGGATSSTQIVVTISRCTAYLPAR
jgi:hypothetical protein